MAEHNIVKKIFFKEQRAGQSCQNRLSRWKITVGMITSGSFVHSGGPLDFTFQDVWL